MKYTDKYTITSLYWDRIWIYFEIKAKCKNNDYVPVWYESNK